MNSENENENEKHLNPMELASLAADDPLRLELVEQLPTMWANERDELESELALTDKIRSLLPEVEMPRRLERKLRAIPRRHGRSRWQRLFNRHTDWRHAAAALVIIGSMLGLTYVAWPQGPELPPQLDAPLGRSIAMWAVQNHLQTAMVPLDIESSDPVAVVKKLGENKFDFPVTILRPKDGATLEGAGTCNFGGTLAAYTEWREGGLRYTLYEFNGSNVGAPDSFQPAVEAPMELWRGDYSYKVAVWPGQGKSCFALVLEKEQAKNLFLAYGYGG